MLLTIPKKKALVKCKSEEEKQYGRHGEEVEKSRISSKIVTRNDANTKIPCI